MATDITLRSVKAASLTYAEMDQNWESLAQTVDAITADYSILITDQNKILEGNIVSGVITLPPVANALGTDTDSFRVTVKNVHNTSLLVAASGGEVIEGFTSVALLEDEVAEFALNSDASEWSLVGFYGPNLVGISASSTEINYSTGVTSGIQSQLNALDSGKQPLDAGLTDIAGLPVTDSNFIVGNGANWVAETGAVARGSMGVDAAGTDNSINVTLAGMPYLQLAGQQITANQISLVQHVSGILGIGFGGTNSASASGARSNLGLGSLATLNGVAQAQVNAAAIGRAELKTTTVSLAGAISTAAAGTAIVLSSYPFFPMIHVTGEASSTINNPVPFLIGHATDGANPDSPRFRFGRGPSKTPESYDVDYRYILG